MRSQDPARMPFKHQKEGFNLSRGLSATRCQRNQGKRELFQAPGPRRLANISNVKNRGSSSCEGGGVLCSPPLFKNQYYLSKVTKSESGTLRVLEIFIRVVNLGSTCPVSKRSIVRRANSASKYNLSWLQPLFFLTLAICLPSFLRSMSFFIEFYIMLRRRY